MAGVQVHQLHLYGKNAVIPFRVRLPSGEFVTTKYRCCFVPTIRGTNLSIRQNAEPIRDLEKIGFEPEQLVGIRKALDHTHGLILVTGPTGSGKSNTRESMLTILERRPIEIYEWGDPIEFESDKRLQISITDDFKWHDALSFALRSNPDVITPSEFRDEHQSRYIIDAALTGHLVVTTLHTTDIPSTFTRLLRFGIPASCLADTITAVICQRLVKVLCPECKIPDEQARLRGLSNAFKAPRETQCRYCASKGYRGQTAIGEVLYITPKLTALIHQLSLGSNGADRSSIVTGTQIVEAARREAEEAGYAWITIQEAANRKVATGITSQSEIDRVLTLIPESPILQVYHWNGRPNLATASAYSPAEAAEFTVQIDSGDNRDAYN
jgi:type II secretory ATPase GspE/PulE/Tfp pilus assembly ATPase PilB-like protein